MLSDVEKHAANMAVSRYGADRAKVQQAVQTVVQAQASGQATDLLELLVKQKLLTPGQAHEVRFSLDKTQIDPNSPKQAAAQPAGGNGSADMGNTSVLTLPGEAPQELRVLGDYHILRPLGEGGTGNVYLGYQQGEGRQVAIKVLSAHLSGSQPSLDRFYREAKSGALLNHPNIVRTVAVGQDRVTGSHYLVLEYIDGPSAQALLDDMGSLPVGDAVHIILDVARALEHAHSRNIVHRDIKPGNILITQSGVAKLADLGLAKRTDETSHLTAARQGFGTPYYMPYEQAMNAKNADARCDIYALGATLYHLVTGEVPFAGANHLEIVDKKNLGVFAPASSRNERVPGSLDRILEKMLARDPRDRYQTASELIVDLERANLGAAVPSFIDRDLALQDTVVRRRLTAPAQPTCPDLNVRQPAGNGKAPAGSFWYLRYRDRKGRVCKAKRTAQQICRGLRDHKLPLQADAARQPEGDYRPLNAYPEFQDTIAALLKGKSARNGTATGDGQVTRVEKIRFFTWRNLWLTLGVAIVLAATAVFLSGLLGG